ncbi:hypothetical protein ACU686_05165 [Yinghuangia aomiensis]
MGVIMAKEESLADLLNLVVGPDEGQMTWREFASRAVDPATGKREGSATGFFRIARGEAVKPTPALMRAIAAASGHDLHRVQAAAGRQFLGMHWNPVADLIDESVHVAFLGSPDMSEERRLHIRAVVARVLQEIEAEAGVAQEPGENHDG